MRKGSRRYRKAVERQNRGYPGSLRDTPAVGDAEWVSQFDAAEQLGVSMMRIGLILLGGRLEPVHNAAGQAGVLRETVEREAAWRSDAGWLRRAWLLLADLGRGLVRGV